MSLWSKCILFKYIIVYFLYFKRWPWRNFLKPVALYWGGIGPCACSSMHSARTQSTAMPACAHPRFLVFPPNQTAMLRSNVWDTKCSWWLRGWTSSFQCFAGWVMGSCQRGAEADVSFVIAHLLQPESARCKCPSFCACSGLDLGIRGAVAGDE